MDEDKRRLVQAWQIKASGDLQTAALLIEHHQTLLDAAVFHCQQAAEKAMKGWMTNEDIIFRKTHDLELLLKDCAIKNPLLMRFSDNARYLTPLAVQFRYPGDVNQPSLEIAQKALRYAREIFENFSC
jgi:HEPN domain-containing protein